MQILGRTQPIGVAALDRERISLSLMSSAPTIQEQGLIVRLATEWQSQELYAFEQGVKARYLNSLVEKGLGTTIEGGWKLTQRRQVRCTSIY